MNAINHISIIEARADRRIGYVRADGGGRRRNLCGAALTDRDLDLPAAKLSAKNGTLEKWVSCPHCRAMLAGNGPATRRIIRGSADGYLEKH